MCNHGYPMNVSVLSDLANVNVLIDLSDPTNVIDCYFSDSVM